MGFLFKVILAILFFIYMIVGAFITFPIYAITTMIDAVSENE